MFKPKPGQLDAVQAFDALGGLFLGSPPGWGKSWVLAQCLARGVRSLLVCPASARASLVDMLNEYGGKATALKPRPDEVWVVSYTQVSRDPELLNRYRPDVLAVDESQALKNVKASAWGRRIARYISDEPQCRVVCSSGSVMHRSALDYMPQLVWALRKRAPCPQSWSGMQARAQWAAEHPEEWLETLRKCPGVFIESAPSWDGELIIREHVLPVSDDSAYARAAATGLAPDGWACEGWALQELLRQLSWGWYYRRDPRPSPLLVERRRHWAQCVTQAKAFGLCDTESGARAHYPAAWLMYEDALRDEPEGEPVATWLLTGPDHDQPFTGLGRAVLSYGHGTIIWVNHPPLGEKLARGIGVPYHHEGARDAQGQRLDETDAPIVVASIRACSASLNCQQFSHNIVLEPPADARVWQQMICRTARQGQLASRVTCDIVVASPQYAADLATARKLAAQIQLETGQAQLLIQGQ